MKTTPNKTTVRKVLQALFLQHFNGFILHGTFVVCQEIYIIFSKIKFFALEYCYCFVITASALPENRQYIRLKVAAKKVFFCFFLQSQNKLRSNKAHIINPLLTSFARSVRESIAFGNLRQYFPVQTSHSVNKSLVLLQVSFGYI